VMKKHPEILPQSADWARGGFRRGISSEHRTIPQKQSGQEDAESLRRDIAGQRKIDDASTVRQTQMSDAMELAHLVHWERDIATGDFVFNDSFYALYATTVEREGGYTMAGEEFERRFIHPDDLPLVRTFVERNRTNTDRELVRDIEHRVIRRDGEIRHLLVRTRISRDSGGRIVRISGANQDITDRIRAEEALRRYELLSEHSRDIILFTDRDTGFILEANVAAQIAYGYTRWELLSMKTAELRTPEEICSMAAQMAEADRGGILFETVHRRKDGSTFPVEVSSRGETINGTRTIICIVRNISVRKAYLEQIQMLKHSIDRHYDAAYWLDHDSQVIYVNNAACETLGYTQNEMIGKSLHEIAPHRSPDELAEFWRKIRAEKFIVTESIHGRKDGSEFPVEIAATYITFAGKEFAAIFARDLTEKRRLEEQLRQAQKMEAVGTLAGGVAHDFNNILTVILGFAELVQANTDDESEIRPFADEIVRSSKRAADLTRSLLAFSRKQQIVPEPWNVNEIVEGAAKMLKRLLPEDILLRLSLTEDSPVACVDANQINQVIMNLATNARDAMAKGGVFTLSTRCTRIDSAFAETHGFGSAGKYVVLSASDTGIGIERETLEHIFDPFFTTKGVGKGTGLGLASAFGIVRQHDGCILVSSSPGTGTTFDVYLPFFDAAPVKESGSEKRASGGTETVLVVEDDGGVRGMVAMILRDHGYAVLEAKDGDEASRLYGEHKDEIGLVILDVVMPGKNGREVLDQILSVNPAAKAIFMSGYTGDIVINKGVNQEGFNFLQKPLSVSGLLQKVREVLDK
jgi:two-component system, cell cycle sensor histidine kinase and response regulator CckA